MTLVYKSSLCAEEDGSLRNLNAYKAKHGDFGGFNDFPPGWRQLTEREFAKSHFFNYSPEFVEYRQMRNPEEHRRIPGPKTYKNGRPSGVSTRLYFMHDGTGYAIVNDYWDGEVLYFKFGCEHKYRELSVEECRERGITHHGMCWHVNECEECKHVDSYDSSD